MQVYLKTSFEPQDSRLDEDQIKEEEEQNLHLNFVSQWKSRRPIDLQIIMVQDIKECRQQS